MDKRTLLFIFSLSTAFLLVNAWYSTPLPQKVTPNHPATEEQLPKILPEITAVAPPENVETTYYVLENDYQQIVFSSKGGSIVEINLPFKTAKTPESVVLPVEMDTKIIEECPKQALFPLVQAYVPDGSYKKQVTGGYYPLLRRSDEYNPSLAALALTSAYKEFSSIPFKVISFSPQEIVFEAKQTHRRILKKFSFPKDANSFPYCLDAEISIDGDRRDISITSGVPEVEWISGASGAILKYRVIKGDKGTVEKVDLPKTTFKSQSILPDWVCTSNGFFGVILDPMGDNTPGMDFIRVSDLPSRLLCINDETFSLENTPGFKATLPYPAGVPSLKLRVFAGPFAESVLSKIDANSLKKYDKPSSFLSCQTFHGFFAFISEPFAKFLFLIMKFFHSLTGSWGLSIILATVVLRILMYPLNQWSFHSMKSMQEVAPLVKAIQEKYKKEPTKAQIEIMNLYKEKKVNPFSGCLPLLIQMPFLIGMFDLLKSTFELRGAPFIPGWINDLSAPDAVFDWHYSVFLLGSKLHILPFILGGIMWLQQSMTANLPKDQTSWTDQQRQQRAMGNIMTVVMTVMFYHFPSGLNIYWISSMLLGILQQWWSMRSLVVPDK